MSKKETIIIDQFGGGISDDPRLESSDHCAMVRHFDISDTKRLVPLHGTVANETKALGIKKFVYAPFNTSYYRLYGYGVKAGAGSYPAVYMYDIDAGLPDSTSWATPNNNESAVTSRNTDVFFYYKNYIYMWTGTNSLSRFDALSLGAFADNYQTIAFTTVAQPVHHKADDVAYFFSDNKVHSLNGTSWTSDVLTLPSNMYIACASAYGNYLAIVCNPKTTMAGNPVVFLWDRDSSLATLSERIDMGQGNVKYIAELNGQLITVTDFFTNNLYGFNQGQVIVKRIVGNQAITIKTLPIDSTSSLFYNTQFVKGDKLYFPAKLINDGDTNMGIYAVNVYGQISLEVTDADATSFEGIYATGNMWWLAHSGDGSVNRTVSDGTFTTSSIYESQKFNGGDASLLKKMVGVSVMTDPLPSAGSVVLSYRINEESAWTTIFTYSTDNGVSHSAINIEATGVTLPSFYECQLRCSSTGGAIITGIKMKYDILDSNLY